VLAEPENPLPDLSSRVQSGSGATAGSSPKIGPAERQGAPKPAVENQEGAGSEPAGRAAATESAATAAHPSEPSKELTVATWGGAYAASQKIAFFDPFTKQTGVRIRQETHTGGLKMLRSELKAGAAPWDVIDLPLQTVDQACKLGLLEHIDPGILKAAPDGTTVAADFLPDGLRECGVASVAWSLAIVYDKRKLKAKSTPARARDFFDLKRFPGKRSMRRGPRLNLELALLADGVAPGEVYGTLETGRGIARALEKLENLRDNIVWWDRGNEPLKHLSDGKAVMATAYNGRIFTTIAGEQQPFGIIWDGQIYNIDLWTVPKGAKNRERALQFITFATQTDRLAHQTKWFPYGPMRKSALRRIGEHAEAGVKMTPYIPTAPENFANALRIDETWWDKHGSTMAAIFDAWLAGQDYEAVITNSIATEKDADESD
jgi:putative spermidine/putrescine transport system substrate-binding protein